MQESLLWAEQKVSFHSLHVENIINIHLTYIKIYILANIYAKLERDLAYIFIHDFLQLYNKS